ncbi:MAG: hypothetical protein IPP86_00280 [Bacteroidetes bacterium]|nr:hypothetical protein [Bacteroidota bacterium]
MKTTARKSISLPVNKPSVEVQQQEFKYSKELLTIFHAALDIVGIQSAEKTTEELNTMFELALTDPNYAAQGTKIAEKLTLINNLTASLRKIEGAINTIPENEFNKLSAQYMGLQK